MNAGWRPPPDVEHDTPACHAVIQLPGDVGT